MSSWTGDSQAAGIPQGQADCTAQALAERLGEVSDLATKADMAEPRAEMRRELNTLTVLSDDRGYRWEAVLASSVTARSREPTTLDGK